MMSNGELSDLTRVKVPTIRYYGKIGLVPDGQRTKDNQRRYGPEAVQRLRFIRHARDLGFEIGTIRDLLEMTGSPQASCHEAESTARAHLADVRFRLAQLDAHKGDHRQCVHEHR